MKNDASSPQDRPDSDVATRNIERIITLEERAITATSWSERVADRVGSFVGTLTFVFLHLAIFGFWLAVNTGWLKQWRPFDPYPFNLLSTTVSAEAVILSAFVLMKQKRMSRIGDRRAHLDLQVNLITEHEASMIIQMLDRLCRKMGIETAENDDALELSKTATLEHLVKELHHRLPDASEVPGEKDANAHLQDAQKSALTTERFQSIA